MTDFQRADAMEQAVIDRNLLFQGFFIGASVPQGLRGCMPVGVGRIACDSDSNLFQVAEACDLLGFVLRFSECW